MKLVTRILAVMALICLTTFAPSACASTGTAVVGHSVTFYLLSVDGTPPFTFQWNKNSVAIPGATGLTLPAGTSGVAGSAYTIASVVAADAGTYTLIVRNPAGSTTSDNATLTVQTGPGNAVTGVLVTINGVTKFYPMS